MLLAKCRAPVMYLDTDLSFHHTVSSIFWMEDLHGFYFPPLQAADISANSWVCFESASPE